MIVIGPKGEPPMLLKEVIEAFKYEFDREPTQDELIEAVGVNFLCEHGVDHAMEDCRKCVGEEMDELFYGGR
jgi:hypothetical protein